MNLLKTSPFILISISLLTIIGCNESSPTTEKKEAESAMSVVTPDSCITPEFDPKMDASIVGAAFGKKLYDTLGIKLNEYTMNPGDSMLLHKHGDHAIYVLIGGKVEVIGEGEAPAIMETKAGDGWVTGPYTDILKNIGTNTIKWVEVSVFRPRCK